jgi:hypothetical protein
LPKAVQLTDFRTILVHANSLDTNHGSFFFYLKIIQPTLDLSV